MSDPPIVRATPRFEEFYQGEYRQVVALAFVLCGDRSRAEELAQDAFVAAFRRWDVVSAMDRPDAWVRRVVANRSVSRFRRIVTETKFVNQSRHETSVDAIDADSVAVWEAVRRLPPRQAEVVALAYYADLTHEDIAAAMGVGIETVRTHLKRARARLAELLGEPA